MSVRNAGREEWIRWYYSVEGRDRRAVFIPTVHIRRNKGSEASIRAALGEKRLKLDFPPEAVRFSGKRRESGLETVSFLRKALLYAWRPG